MSFDLFYMSSHWGNEPVDQKNPWTGEVHVAKPRLPMTPDELSAVAGLLSAAAPKGPDAHNCYVVEFPDGGGAEVFASNLSEGFMVAIRRRLSPAFLEFLFRLMKVGNLLMCPEMEDDVTVGASERSFDEAPDDWPNRIVCNSAEELGLLLSNGFDAWKHYRDEASGR